MLKAIQMDCGCKFVNMPLFEWCHSKGIQMQMTTLYSPSPNGVAEHMNHMLEELAQVM